MRPLLALALALAALPASRGQQPDTGMIGVVPSALTAPGSPQDSILDAETKQVASQLRCPVCQGLSLQDSPSDLARQMRALVHDQLAAGRTPEQVKQYFISKYGEWILLQPEAHGFNLVAYILPAFVLLAGVVLVGTLARRWTRTPAVVDAPAADADGTTADAPSGETASRP